MRRRSSQEEWAELKGFLPFIPCAVGFFLFVGAMAKWGLIVPGLVLAVILAAIVIAAYMHRLRGIKDTHGQNEPR